MRCESRADLQYEIEFAWVFNSDVSGWNSILPVLPIVIRIMKPNRYTSRAIGTSMTHSVY
jgi:hypothetical protein